MECSEPDCSRRAHKTGLCVTHYRRGPGPIRGWQRRDETQRGKKLRLRYGIGEQEFDELLARQDGLCAICFTDEPGGKHDEFHVDHDHESGSVRGLLCFNCNVAIGLLNDDAHVVEAAAAYLRAARSGTNFP